MISVIQLPGHRMGGGGTQNNVVLILSLKNTLEMNCDISKSQAHVVC